MWYTCGKENRPTKKACFFLPLGYGKTKHHIRAWEKISEKHSLSVAYGLLHLHCSRPDIIVHSYPSQGKSMPFRPPHLYHLKRSTPRHYNPCGKPGTGISFATSGSGEHPV